MKRSRLLNTTLAGLVASLMLAGAAFAGIENKPAKASWVPSRVVNADVDEGTGTFVVDLSADKEVLGAQLWVSGSLAGLLDWDPTPFDILEGTTVQVTFTLLQTPDEVGHTIGGTVHLRANGKNLAKPLNLSLKKTAEEGDPGVVVVEGEGEVKVKAKTALSTRKATCRSLGPSAKAKNRPTSRGSRPTSSMKPGWRRFPSSPTGRSKMYSFG